MMIWKRIEVLSINLRELCGNELVVSLCVV